MRYRARRTPSVLAAATLVAAALVPAAPAAAVTNLVRVPGFETLSKGFPQCWTRFTTGKGKGKVSVSRKRHGGKRALQVKVVKKVKGTRGFTQAASCAPKTAAGARYDISFYYRSTAAGRVVLWRKSGGGDWRRWYTLGTLKKSKGFRKAKGRTAAVPPGTTRLRYSIEATGRGTLIVDDNTVTRVPPAPRPTSKPTPKPTPPPVPRSVCQTGKGALCATGSWTVQQASDEVRAMHAVVLPGSGKVLLIAGSGNSDRNFKAGKFTSQIYDPKTGAFKVINTPSDMFCAGHAHLPDGRILIMGGTGNYARGDGKSAYAGLKSSYVFDPATEKYTPAGDMVTGHWYPSATAMGNGDILSFGGYREFMDHTENSRQTEQFSWALRKWLGPEATKQYVDWGTYPGMILMQDGRLFYTGSYVFSYPKFRPKDSGFATAAIYDHRDGTITEVPGLRRPKQRDQAMSVLLPPAQDQRVLTMGGGDVNKRSNTPSGSGDEPHAHDNVDVIDLKAADPQYRPGVENLPAGKIYPSAVLLPDGKVFETGGSEYTRRDDVHEASILDPETGRFQRNIPADPVGRGYHNTAMLLPDGRVLAAGGNPASNTFDTSISIYSPSYLYKTNRPVITSAPASWGYGQTREIRTSGPIARATLIRPAAVTHSSDPNQRYVDLKITNNGTAPRLGLDPNRNLTPPGWYMLFVVNADGVPSVAKWVKVG
ncbi:galactose oxidase early set domain-containing protein [Actinocorallia longicatena]|uniref:Glyoxal oxidase-like protein n=1 Tax=Actinocorallia longicatena TaxID=111803 RepID=A0ABP6PW12_9ACTN